MLSEFLKKNLESQAKYVTYGYGQVEPNHLSAQRTGQIYAQLPADKEINMLEQGQFVKYDYAAGRVNFAGKGEWMLVYNEIKLYREHQMDCEFAMIKDNYQARVFSPFGTEGEDRQTRYYNGVDATGEAIEDVTAPADPYSLHYNEDPFHITGPYKEAMMPEGTTMVPRVFKTNVGDIFTTNTVNAETLAVGDVLTPGANGILEVGEGDMQWEVVKVYTMPDGQKGVKIMRIA
jgi:hypothetical protein